MQLRRGIGAVLGAAGVLGLALGPGPVAGETTTTTKAPGSPTTCSVSSLPAPIDVYVVTAAAGAVAAAEATDRMLSQWPAVGPKGRFLVVVDARSSVAVEGWAATTVEAAKNNVPQARAQDRLVLVLDQDGPGTTPPASALRDLACSPGGKDDAVPKVDDPFAGLPAAARFVVSSPSDPTASDFRIDSDKAGWQLTYQKDALLLLANVRVTAGRRSTELYMLESNQTVAIRDLDLSEGAEVEGTIWSLTSSKSFPAVTVRAGSGTAGTTTSDQGAKGGSVSVSPNSASEPRTGRDTKGLAVALLLGVVAGVASGRFLRRPAGSGAPAATAAVTTPTAPPGAVPSVAFPVVLNGRGQWTRFLEKEDRITVIDPDDVERVQPAREGQGCSWAFGNPELAAAAFWSERIPGKGEDASPSLVFDQRTRRGLIGVYDGAGGAGSAPARVLIDGTTVSGAFVGSRVAREATERWFQADLDEAKRLGSGDHLAAVLQDQLRRAAAEGIPQNSRIAGSLQRTLPTTLAAAVVSNEADAVEVHALWAGDSRVHVLTPDHGLVQLSLDDAPITDALELLINDSPMTNLVCADRPFVVNERIERFYRPVVVLAATDGCFGYVATPAHYEFLLLHHLQRSQSLDQWIEFLLVEFQGFTSDDASLVMSAFGFVDFEHLRSSFAPRAAQLRAEHWAPMEGLDRSDDTFVDARRSSWDRYRAGYEALITPTDSDTVVSTGEGVDAEAVPVVAGEGSDAIG